MPRLSVTLHNGSIQIKQVYLEVEFFAVFMSLGSFADEFRNDKDRFPEC